MRFKLVGYYKLVTMICTVCAILVVDFPVLFDRSLCKAEDYGWALMDVGVSSIMLSMGASSKVNIQHKTGIKSKPIYVELVQ